VSIVKIRGSDFKDGFATVNRTFSASVSKRRLLKCAVNVGLQVYGGSASMPRNAVALSAYKALAMKCAVTFGGRELGLSREFIAMDASEKANISFWIGMAFAALAADECLGVNRLYHAASLRRSKLLTMASRRGRSLADFVGQDQQGRWHSIEAKARQDRVSAKVRQAWKKQAVGIARVGRASVATRSYSYTCVDSPYRVYLVDPDGPTQDGASPQPTEVLKTAIRRYYGTLAALLSEGDTRIINRGGHDVSVALVGYDTLDQEYMYLGMATDAFRTVANSELPARIEARDLSDTYIGSDGVVVVTSRSNDLDGQRNE